VLEGLTEKQGSFHYLLASLEGNAPSLEGMVVGSPSSELASAALWADGPLREEKKDQNLPFFLEKRSKEWALVFEKRLETAFEDCQKESEDC